MLEKDYQLRAYKNLVLAGGMETPEAIITSGSCATMAKSLADQVEKLILATVSYPGAIVSSINAITTTAETLTEISKLADSHAVLLKTNADLSVLLQLNIGWDVHCRVNELEASELPISQAISDNRTPLMLLDAIRAIDITIVVAAMNEINQVLNIGAGSSTGDGTAQPTPTITQEQIEALKSATDTLSACTHELHFPCSALQALFDKAALSADVSMQAYTNAVGIALAEASLNNASTASAVRALVPDAVLRELKIDQSNK